MEALMKQSRYVCSEKLGCWEPSFLLATWTCPYNCFSFKKESVEEMKPVVASIFWSFHPIRVSNQPCRKKLVSSQIPFQERIAFNRNFDGGNQTSSWWIFLPILRGIFCKSTFWKIWIIRVPMEWSKLFFNRVFFSKFELFDWEVDVRNQTCPQREISVLLTRSMIKTGLIWKTTWTIRILMHGKK